MSKRMVRMLALFTPLVLLVALFSVGVVWAAPVAQDPPPEFDWESGTPRWHACYQWECLG